MKEQKVIQFIDLEDNERDLRIVIEFYLEQFEKDYVVAVPVDAKEEEDVEFFVFTVTRSEDGEETYEPLETEEEWALCEEVIDTLFGEEELRSDLENMLN